MWSANEGITYSGIEGATAEELNWEESEGLSVVTGEFKLSLLEKSVYSWNFRGSDGESIIKLLSARKQTHWHCHCKISLDERDNKEFYDIVDKNCTILITNSKFTENLYKQIMFLTMKKLKNILSNYKNWQCN